MAIVVTVAGAGDVVAGGLQHILGQAPDIQVVDQRPLRFPHVGAPPDVVLYDVMAVQHDGGADLVRLINAGESAVVVVGRELRPDLALRAPARSAAGYVSLEASACEILSVIREAACRPTCPDEARALGREAGLTPRESLILADVVRGFANTEIACRQWVSINTVKSYIRSTYRKIGVTTRAQAVSWGLQHGFDPQEPPLRPATPDRSSA